MNTKERVKKIISRLKKEYGNVSIPLNYSNSLQLLVATILSAQCTDERVNKVTPALFSKYKNAADFAQANPKDLESMIHSTGFYKAKAKNIINCCKVLVAKYKGEPPSTLEELTKLPGVGRKTANVLIGGLWHKPAIVVDTHVKRLSTLLDFTKQKDPVKIESDLMEIVPKKDWYTFSLLLIHHGRKVCIARNPRCLKCQIKRYCPSAQL